MNVSYMNRIFLLLYLLSICSLLPSFSQVSTGENVAVTRIESGEIRGYINNGIYTYKGIPYATANRFENRSI